MDFSAILSQIIATLTALLASSGLDLTTLQGYISDAIDFIMGLIGA